MKKISIVWHPTGNGHIHAADLPLVWDHVFDGHSRAIFLLDSKIDEAARPVRAFRMSAGLFPLQPPRSPSARQRARIVRPGHTVTEAVMWDYIAKFTEQPIQEDWNEQRRLYGFPER